MVAVLFVLIEHGEHLVGKLPTKCIAGQFDAARLPCVQAKDEQIRRWRALGDEYGDRVVAAEAVAAQAAERRTAAEEKCALAERKRAAMAAELGSAVNAREDIARLEWSFD